MDTGKKYGGDQGRPNPSNDNTASGIPSPFPVPGVQVPGVEPGKWNTRLCHCCDEPANCFITCFCPCITFGQVAAIVNRGSTTCCENAVIYTVFSIFGLACLYSCMYRSKLRVQYDLDEKPCADCLVHLCCETCALCQEYRELHNRGFDMGIGWDANINRHVQRRMTTAPTATPPMTR